MCHPIAPVLSSPRVRSGRAPSSDGTAGSQPYPRMQIHASSIAKKGDIDWEAVVKLSEGFNGTLPIFLSFAVPLAPYSHPLIPTSSPTPRPHDDRYAGADMRNVCTEAGMMAIRADRDYVVEEDFMKAVRKVGETKKLESKLDYSKV